MENGAPALSSTAALVELDRVDRVVRSRSRWYGRFLLALGGGTVAYYAVLDVVAPATPRERVGLSLGWTAFVVLLARWARRQPVTRRGMRPLRITLMAIYSVLVAATVLLDGTVWHDPPGRWALGLVPALPCLLGAWAVLRR